MARSSSDAPAPDALPHSQAGLLRLITCGSVDDGKSTLIGRLLHDSKNLFEDQVEAVRAASRRRGAVDGGVDLSLITDGLRAEREQGITIDVAYRYFATARRSFILADTPGHVQYTRNMVTGASTADAAIILIDARQGVLEQTRRHACLAALLGVSRLVVCVNKMDLVGFDRAVFERVRASFESFAQAARPDAGRSVAERAEVTFIPISALGGDNVVERSSSMAWYNGSALLETLENLPVARGTPSDSGVRFPVQYVIRPQNDEHHDYRGYAGRLACGELSVGDEVVALPAGGASTRVKRMHIGQEDVSSCRAPESVAIELEDDLDISRGDMLVKASEMPGGSARSTGSGGPRVTQDIEATVVWMASQALTPGKRMLLKHTTRQTPAIVKSITHKLNIQTLDLEASASSLGMNEIARVRLRTGTPLVVDDYAVSRETGAMILIDEHTSGTCGAGMIHISE